jgi:hypothetical protein
LFDALVLGAVDEGQGKGSLVGIYPHICGTNLHHENLISRPCKIHFKPAPNTDPSRVVS